MTQTALAPYVRSRLSIMMFLQYAIWGAWLPVLYSFLSGHLQFSGTQIGYCFSAGAIGAILGPFLAGQLADRTFATQKILGVSHLIGAVLVYLMGITGDFNYFILLNYFLLLNLSKIRLLCVVKVVHILPIIFIIFI